MFLKHWSPTTVSYNNKRLPVKTRGRGTNQGPSSTTAKTLLSSKLCLENKAFSSIWACAFQRYLNYLNVQFSLPPIRNCPNCLWCVQHSTVSRQRRLPLRIALKVILKENRKQNRKWNRNLTNRKANKIVTSGGWDLAIFGGYPPFWAKWKQVQRCWQQTWF